MANLVLNEKKLAEAQAGWAAPNAPSPGGQVWAPPTVPGAPTAPVTDGPVSRWSGGVMTLSGTITATGVLFTLLLISATVGWFAATGPETVEGRETFEFPGLALAGVAVGFACVIALMFRPQLARVLAPVYAIAQGFAVGAISKGYETLYDGIVVQAAGATLGVFAVMLVLYRTRIIKVTARFRKVIIFATLGIMAFYLVSFVISMFGADIRFFDEPNALGIGFSIVVSVLAALNLTLDFDFIERGTKMGLAKHFEWYAAFGLLVTIVWLYLELLRLLSKLQQR
jgi:uncharacterized YccA/Bax inhibitor family protein